MAQEFTSPISFALGSLLPGMGAGLGYKMALDGCKNPVDVVLDIPAGDVALPALKNAYAAAGGDPNAWKVVKIAAVPQDYSAQVAEATEGTDCIAGGISDSNWAAWLPAMAAAGANQRLYGLQGNLNGKIAEQFPELTEGGIVSGSYPNIDEADVGRLPRLAREVRRSGPRLEQPRRTRHVGRPHGVHQHRRRHVG